MDRFKQTLPIESRLGLRGDSVHPQKEPTPYNKALPMLPSESRLKPGTKMPRTSTRIPKSGLKLMDLPNELLLQITQHLRIECLPPIVQDRFDGKERIIFVQRAATLINLSLTSKKIYPIAQEVLLHTVVLGGFDGLPAIVSLVRFLLQRPEMGKHVKRLRLGLPPNKIHYFKDAKAKKEGKTTSMLFGRAPRDIEHLAVRAINSSALSETVRKNWLDELKVNYARPLCGVLLSLTPYLGQFSISHSLGMMTVDNMGREMFGLGKVKTDGDVDLWGLPGLKSSMFGRMDGRNWERKEAGNKMVDKFDEGLRETQEVWTRGGVA
jgi:hypothetical protein